jgi:transposase InsO family protein
VTAHRLKREFPELSVLELCSLLDLPRASYYRDLSPAPGRGESDLVERIERIVLSFPGYGYRRVWAQLVKEGAPMGQKALRRLMEERSLLCQIRRRWVRTTDSEHGAKVHPNLAKGLLVDRLDQLWVTDITYIRLPHGFCYLSAILDAHSRKAVAWHLSKRIDSHLVLAALGKALQNRRPAPGWIHHSDRGVQYACRGYSEAVLSGGGRLSMSSRACHYDNAKAESFFATLKKEEVHLQSYASFEEAQASIGHYIDAVYNAERLHSRLGYESPDQFEAKIRREGDDRQT